MSTIDWYDILGVAMYASGIVYHSLALVSKNSELLEIPPLEADISRIASSLSGQSQFHRRRVTGLDFVEVNRRSRVRRNA